MSFPKRQLTNPVVFKIEVGENGFNAYRNNELFAASSAASTFVEVCNRMLREHNPNSRFDLIERKDVS